MRMTTRRAGSTRAERGAKAGVRRWRLCGAGSVHHLLMNGQSDAGWAGQGKGREGKEGSVGEGALTQG
jgi:hypothetical protein